MFAWYLRNAPVPARDAFPLRLLPAYLRTPLKARIAARQYEQTLIAAPNRVFEHVMVHDLALAKRAVAAVQPKPAVALVPRPSATRQVSNRTLPDTLQADVAALRATSPIRQPGRIPSADGCTVSLAPRSQYPTQSLALAPRSGAL